MHKLLKTKGERENEQNNNNDNNKLNEAELKKSMGLGDYWTGHGCINILNHHRGFLNFNADLVISTVKSTS